MDENPTPEKNEAEPARRGPKTVISHGLPVLADWPPEDDKKPDETPPRTRWDD